MDGTFRKWDCRGGFMADKKNQDPMNDFKQMAKQYHAVFIEFLAKTGDIEQAYRLTRDLFSAMFWANAKKDNEPANVIQFINGGVPS